MGLLATSYAVYHTMRPIVHTDPFRVEMKTDLEFEYDFKKLRPSLPSSGPAASLPEKLKETRSPAIILTESRDDAMEVVAAVKQIRADRGDTSTIKSVKSVYSALPGQQQEKLQIINSIRQLLEDEDDLIDEDDRARVDSLRQYLEVAELTLEDLPADMTNSFLSKDGKVLDFVMINASVALRDGRNAMRFAREIKKIVTPTGKTYHASSSHIIFAEMLELMLRDSLKAVVITLLVVALVLLIDLRSFTDVAIVLTPLLTALLWVTRLHVPARFQAQHLQHGRVPDYYRHGHRQCRARLSSISGVWQRLFAPGVADDGPRARRHDPDNDGWLCRSRSSRASRSLLDRHGDALWPWVLLHLGCHTAARALAAEGTFPPRLSSFPSALQNHEKRPTQRAGLFISAWFLILERGVLSGRHFYIQTGAGDRTRTGDNHVGNVELYQLSYSRQAKTGT